MFQRELNSAVDDIGEFFEQLVICVVSVGVGVGKCLERIGFPRKQHGGGACFPGVRWGKWHGHLVHLAGRG